MREEFREQVKKKVPEIATMAVIMGLLTLVGWANYRGDQNICRNDFNKSAAVQNYLFQKGLTLEEITTKAMISGTHYKIQLPPDQTKELLKKVRHLETCVKLDRVDAADKTATLGGPQ